MAISSERAHTSSHRLMEFGSVQRKGSARRTLCPAALKLDSNRLLEVAKQAADAGAAVVMDAVDKPRNISFKGTTDLVTDVDKASEAAVLRVLRSAFPDHAVLGEEGGISGDTSSEYLWCVDPLDGTTNFAHSYPSFAVSVGVLRHAVPVAACVIEFLGGPHKWTTRTFVARRNGGAFCDGKPLCVSRVSDVQRSLLVTGFGYEHDEVWAANMRLFQHFTDVSQGVRRLGAAAVDLCHVALGVVDAYWEFRLKPWDVAAGALVLEEAGGLLTTMRGTAYSVFERSMLASNGNEALHTAVLGQTEAECDRLISEGYELGPWMVPVGYGLHGGRQAE